jgi:hypothetical protein
VADLFVALMHYPVLNRNGRIITSAITSLDLHDIARSSRSYGVRGFYVVHPTPDQRAFAASVIDHWRLDEGRLYDSRRREALDLIEIVADLDDALDAARAIAGTRPLTVYTSARAADAMSYADARARLLPAEAPPLMIMLGTGFGLGPAVRDRADLVLEAIRGPGDYNHLSVRAAASVILDRLRGQ